MIASLSGTIARVEFYNGDTRTMLFRIRPGRMAETSVRVRGVDTAEIRRKCEAETGKARVARDWARAARCRFHRHSGHPRGPSERCRRARWARRCG